MTKDSNKNNRNRSGTSNVSVAIPSLIKQVRENTLSVLSNQFTHFFNSCDDLFFELASKAGSNNEQNLYFDAMREIRLKKTALWQQFKSHYEQHFIALTQSRLQTVSNIGPSLESIGLIDKDDMEIDVAIASIVSRARVDNQEQLYQLTIRFDALLPDIPVTEANNPLDPGQLCNAIKQSLAGLSLCTKSKVILLKHLDRTMVPDFKNVYTLANDLLINAGILPQIRFGASTSTTQNTQTRTDSLIDTDPTSPSTEVRRSGLPGSTNTGSHPHTTQNATLGLIQGMLEQLRHNGGTPTHLISQTTSTTPIQQARLLGALTAIQLSSAYLQSPKEFSIRSTIKQILAESKRTGKESGLEESDEDIINLVSMFFDYILDDRNIPVAFQALISRLQIPILKVALKDRRFFSDNRHPARQLINEIAAHCVGWEEHDESTQDRLYKETNRVIHIIIEQFTGDIGLFSQTLKQFQNAIKVDDSKAAILEKRTQEAAQGKAKAEHAKQQVNQLLYNKLNDIQLPDTILNFLTKEWKQVLLYTYLKQGPDSSDWLEAKQVIDQLTWSMRQHHDERSLNRLERIKGEVLPRLSHGLEAVSISRETALNTLSIIEQLFEMVLQRRLDKTSLLAFSPEHAARLDIQIDERHPDWTRLTAVERQKIQLQTIEKEFINQVRKIEPGTWLSYSSPDGNRKFRCKLAMITKPGDRYVFVNRYGLRTFEKSISEFANDFRRDCIEILEGGVLFDRAMNNISGTLKKLAS